VRGREDALKLNVSERLLTAALGLPLLGFLVVLVGVAWEADIFDSGWAGELARHVVVELLLLFAGVAALAVFVAATPERWHRPVERALERRARVAFILALLLLVSPALIALLMSLSD